MRSRSSPDMSGMAQRTIIITSATTFCGIWRPIQVTVKMVQVQVYFLQAHAIMSNIIVLINIILSINKLIFIAVIDNQNIIYHCASKCATAGMPSGPFDIWTEHQDVKNWRWVMSFHLKSSSKQRVGPKDRPELQKSDDGVICFTKWWAIDSAEISEQPERTAPLKRSPILVTCAALTSTTVILQKLQQHWISASPP